MFNQIMSIYDKHCKNSYNASNFIEIEHVNCIVVSSVNVAKQIHVFLSCIFYLKCTLDTFYIEEYADFVRLSISLYVERGLNNY